MRPAVEGPVRTTRQLVVGVSDLAVSNDPDLVLATFALGSCVGITAWDPRAGAGALLHCLLPESSLAPENAVQKPAMFCDSGIPRMLAQLESLGAERRRLRVCLAGAARVLEGADYFDIGRRNLLAAKRLLWQHGLMVHAEDSGGNLSRSLKLCLADGAVTVKTPGLERPLSTPTAFRS